MGKHPQGATFWQVRLFRSENLFAENLFNVQEDPKTYVSDNYKYHTNIISTILGEKCQSPDSLKNY